MRFHDRQDAGHRLAERVAEVGLDDAVVLGLPRGGVPVAAPVAAVLKAPLDVYVVRKVGAPGHPELGVGAVAEGLTEPVINEDIARHLGLTDADVRTLAAGVAELVAAQVAAYRSGRELLPLRGRDVVLVDDGLATGVTAAAGLRALRAFEPRSLHFAAPVCARQSIPRIAAVADGVLSVLIQPDLRSVGEWYDDFTQTTDEEVLRLLASTSEQDR